MHYMPLLYARSCDKSEAITTFYSHVLWDNKLLLLLLTRQFFTVVVLLSQENALEKKRRIEYDYCHSRGRVAIWRLDVCQIFQMTMVMIWRKGGHWGLAQLCKKENEVMEILMVMLVGDDDGDGKDGDDDDDDQRKVFSVLSARVPFCPL